MATDPAASSEFHWARLSHSKIAQALAILRFPLLLAVLYAARHPVVNQIERWFDIDGITGYVIFLSSTALARGIFFVALSVFLLVVCLLLTRLKPTLAYCIFMGIAAAAILSSFQWIGTGRRYAVLATAMLATNALPDALLRRVERALNVFLAAGIGLAELLFFRRFLKWISGPATSFSSQPTRWRIVAGMVPGILIACGFAVLSLDGRSLVGVEQSLRLKSNVTVLDRGDFNWIALGPGSKHLFVSGHGLPRLRRYDTANWEKLESSEETAGAQGFAHDWGARELYVFNTHTERLQYFDADTLQLRRSVPIPGVSPGDSWIVLDKHSDRIVLASEADQPIGTPLVVINRSTGQIADRRNLDSGVVLTNPSKPVLYLSFYRRASGLLRYDLANLQITGRTAADARAERMAFWETGNEVLVTSPVESRVLRYSPDSLHLKGHFRTVFGVRAIAVDEGRSLAVCGSLSTGKISVTDLKTGERTADFYLGPWLRTITLDTAQGVAYVSSNGALYRVNYLGDRGDARD